MIYISHLLSDEEMGELLQASGAGIESIDFSISDNLDQLPQTVREYREKMKRLGVEHVILHGPFLDVNPCAYDRLVREVTMTRFAQCCEAGRELGAERIVFHSGINPYVYYKESWAEHVALFWQEFLEKCPDMEIVLENVFDDDWRTFAGCVPQSKPAEFPAVPGYRPCPLLFLAGCAGVGSTAGTVCFPCAYP